MSGHSKWSQIKRQKGKADIKKGLTFTKLAKAIIIAVKQGGGITDPNNNFRLRLAIDAARTSNMPKENIDRAIQRAKGKEAGDLAEVIYEGFAPFGISVIIEAATDNTQRTTSEIKNIFSKAGGSFGQPGSVSYQFTQSGIIEVAKTGKTFDEIFSSAVDSGAQDLEDGEESVIVYTKPNELDSVKKALSEKGFEIINAQIVRKANIENEVGEEDKGRVKNFIDSINELDDVQNVYSNLKE